MSFQLSPNVDPNKVFLVQRSELEGRLDTSFYQPKYTKLEEAIKNSKWGYKKVGVLAKRIADGPFGSDLKTDEYQEEGHPLLRVSNIRTGEIGGKLVFISEEKQKKLKRSAVYPGDVLLTKAGAILGYSAVFPNSLIEGNITSHLVTITCKESINSYYLSHFFRSTVGQLQIYRWGNKSTRPELNTTEVKGILVTTPPDNIQAKIISKMEVAYGDKKKKEIEAQNIISSIDDFLLVELGIKFPTLDESLTSRIFKVRNNLLEGRFDPYYHKTRFKKIESAIQNSGLEVVALGDLFWINRGGSPRPINAYFTDAENGVNWVKIGDTKGVRKYITKTKQKIKPEGAQYSRKVNPGDFVLSNSMSFGRPYLMATSGYIHDGWLSFKPKRQDIDENYIHSILSSSLIYELFKKSTIGGVVENLNINLVKKIKIPLPTPEKQKLISQHVQEIYEQADELQKVAKQELEQAKLEVEKMILGEQ